MKNREKHGFKNALKIFSITAFAATVFIFSQMIETAQARHRNNFEVWLVDQSNTNGLAYGGTIYIYDGGDLTDHNPSNAEPDRIINLGAETSQLCFNQTGANPVRPHMLMFNSTDTHTVLSFVASGHVVFFDARTRQPLACFRTEIGAGGARQAHASWITGDDEYVIVANQNGKKLERIDTNFRTNTFTQEPAATLNLATCTTPNGFPCQDAELRPDNAPICPFTASDNGAAFISLRGGGMFVVDWEATPMSIIGEYTRQNAPPNGCGFVEARGMVYGNGGGGTATHLDGFAVYRVPLTGYSPQNPPNQPFAQLLFNDESPNRDAHGVAATKHERYIWMGDRGANLAEIFDARTGLRVNTVNLVSRYSADPTPDLFAVSPDYKYFFASTRGPNPLSGDPHSSTGTHPGMLVIRVNQSGRDGYVKGLIPITNIDAGGVQRADAHGIRLRRK